MSWQDILDEAWHPSKFVYHYTKPDTALGKILVDRRLKLGSFASVKDPWESKHWNLVITSAPRDSAGKADKLVEWFNHAAKNRVKVLCVTRDRRPAEIGRDGNLPASPPGSDFHRGYARPRMWAQYGDCHRGVCLAFDRVKLNALIKQAAGDSRVYCGAVNYSDYLGGSNAFEIDYEHVERLGKDEAVRRHMDDFRGAFFFQKARDWRDEVEYRWVVLGHNAKPLCVHFGSALAAVILGADFAPSYRSALRHVWEGPVFDMSWTNGEPRCDPAGS